jgi:hypothetical protein
MSIELPEGVTTDLQRESVSATTVVDAAPEEVFEFLRRPANHSIISGDHSVTGATAGPERLSAGDRFGMAMKVGVPYRIRNKVVEFEDGRRIAWCHPGKHRWRWEVEPAGEGRSKVTETFDMSTAVFPPALRLFGFPKRHEPNVARSVANVAAHFAP